jgi:hypothetical protein
VQSPLPENEGSRLESLHSFRILGTSCEQIFDDILRLAILSCDTPIGKIGFVDQERGSKRKSALSSTRFRESGRFLPMHFCDPTS